MSNVIEVVVKMDGVVVVDTMADTLSPSVTIQNEMEDVSSGIVKEYRVASRHIHIEWRVPLEEVGR